MSLSSYLVQVAEYPAPWGADDEEVTFDDLTNGTGKDKPGYEKIWFCGEQAALDGFDYCWIDTCCIDKANKAELSQATNSMFRWYRNATGCYVYLPDDSDSKRPVFRGSVQLSAVCPPEKKRSIGVISCFALRKVRVGRASGVYY